MKKSSIPDGFEDTGTRQSGHIIIRCTKKVVVNDIEVQCTYKIRNCQNPAPHICRGVAPTPVEERRIDIMKDIACFIGKANLALITVEKDYFKEFMAALIKLGQENPTIPAEDPIPKVNRKNIRGEVIAVGNEELEKKMFNAHKQPAITISIDAGTLSHRHMIDFCITSPSLKPIFYKATTKQIAGVDEYMKTTESVLLELFQKYKINVVAIVTDNLPLQVIALSHWSPTSLLNTSSNEKIRKILFFPCLCHTTQLIVECTEEQDAMFASLNGTLRSMIQCLRTPYLRDLIGANCPEFVSTRWLSRMESISFILEKKDKLMKIIEEIESLEIPNKVKRNIILQCSEVNFSKIHTLGKLVYPFYVLIKIFEKNNGRQFLAIPCFEQLEEWINDQLRNEEMLEYHSTLTEFLNQLNVRKKKTMHWELLLASFVLTLPGRYWLRSKIINEHADSISIDKSELQYQFKKLRFDYQIEDDGNLDRIDVDYSEIEELPSENPEASEGAENEPEEGSIFAYRSITFDRINVPLPPSHSDGLFASIVETLKEVSIRISGKCETVEEAFCFYIFNEVLFKHFSRIKDIKSHPELGWLSEVLNTKLVELTNVALHILPVVSSETSVERCFSQQKQILSEIRLRTKDELANARFILAD